MQSGGFDGHLLIECIVGVASLAGFAISTSIKLAQSDDRAEVIAHQAAIKEELVAAAAKDRENLAVHIKEDEGKFGAIKESLARIEGRLGGVG